MKRAGQHFRAPTAHQQQMLTIKLKPTQKKSPVQISFFLLSGEGRQTHPSFPILLLPASYHRGARTELDGLFQLSMLGNELFINHCVTWSRAAAPGGSAKRSPAEHPASSEGSAGARAASAPSSGTTLSFPRGNSCL